jgi:exodeoxyribonuclease VII small subunit
MTQQSQSFKANYDRLEAIADELRNQEEADIDRLLPMVDEATKAYAFCKARLDEVEKALNERLSAQSEPTGQPSTHSTSADDAVPF